MDASTSREVCDIIMGLLVADGELHADEARFIARLRARFGLDAEATRPASVDAEASLARLRRLQPADREETLALMIAAAAADGVIHPAERVLIGAVAEELSIEEDDVDRRLAAALGA